MKSKQNTLTIPGPMQISFDYTICIGDKEIKKGKYKEIIQKIRKEDRYIEGANRQNTQLNERRRYFTTVL